MQSLVTIWILPILAGQATPPPPVCEALDAELTAYFKAASAEERSRIAAQIEAAEGVTVSTVAARLHHLPLWRPLPPGRLSFDLDIGDGQPRTVRVRLPPGYDASQPWPLMIALHGTGGRAEHILDYTVSFLGENADVFIIAAPQGADNGPFNIHDEIETGQCVRVLRELRRRFHIDSNRVFVTGYSKGGHGTCSASVMYAEQFAGALPLAGGLALPQGEGLFPQFLPNLRYVPMLMVWGALDTTGPDGRESPTGGIAGMNRRFAEAARELSLPVTTVEHAELGHGGIRPPAEELSRLLSARRAVNPPTFSHWFRFPGQGRAYWARLVEFDGEPWNDDRIHVTIQPGEDPNEAFLRETRRRLGRLEGSIDGQTVTVRTKRIRVLDVLLNDELVDLDEPVHIKLNGRRVFAGMLERRVETLLDVAANDWDFDRLFSARVRVGLGRPGRQM